MITKAEWLKAVKQEARNLKKYATKEELQKLDFETFDPENPQCCIYGQIADNCATPRAVELIKKCCNKMVKSDEWMLIGAETFTKLKNRINGKVGDLGRIFASSRYFSSIEAYIVLKDAKNENLINFLKGKTKNLDL